MNRLRYFILFVCLSPAMLAASIAGFRQWAHDGFEEPTPPDWLGKANAPVGGPRNLREKVLLNKGKEHADPQGKQGIGIPRHGTNDKCGYRPSFENRQDPDSLGEGSDQLARSAPSSNRPDAGFEFLPANGTLGMEG
jgi:hypothetical protein